MVNLEKSAKELADLVRQFKFEEALDKFYADDIVTVENESPPTVGLAAYRAAAKKYLASISNEYAELRSMIVSDGITVMEWRYRFDHKEWGKWDKVQVSVQRWKDNKIVHERHHYMM